MKWICCTALWLLFGWGAGLVVAAVPARPNVVIFLVDDMGVMDTSVPFLVGENGKPVVHPLNRFYRTPNMEQLAARGIRFSQFNAMSVCSPSRVTIMTGQNAARHRTTNWVNAGQNNKGDKGPPEWKWEGLKQSDVTLARILHEAGYQTFHVGKAHFGAGADPLLLGFDKNIAGGGMGQPGSYFSEQWYGNKPTGKQMRPQRNAVPHLEKYHDSGVFLTEALTLEANSLIDSAVKSDKPFFLHFAHYAVHSPFQDDPRFINNYPEDSQYPRLRSFAALIEGMDKSLGDLLAELDRTGVAEQTLVIFLGDNGSDAPRGREHEIGSSEPLRGKKGTHYEGGVRAPCLVAWARPNAEHPQQKKFPITPGAVQTQLTTICDLFPTVLDACDVDVPTRHVVDGKSWKRLLNGQPDPEHPTTFLMHYPHQHRSPYFTSYRNGDWKVIYHYFPSDVSENERYQLYDLKNDPAEQTNLAASRPEELTRMMGELIAGLTAANALFPVDPETKQPAPPRMPAAAAK